MTSSRLIVWQCPACGNLWVRRADIGRPWLAQGGEWWHVIGRPHNGGDRWSLDGTEQACSGRAQLAGGQLASAALAAYAVGGDEAVWAMIERP